MSDGERTTLARLAGNGDLQAAERLVSLLRREYDVTISATTRLIDLTDADLGGAQSRRTRLLNVIKHLRLPGAPHKKVETVLDLSLFRAEDLRYTRGVGRVFEHVARDLVERAGLKFVDEREAVS